MIIYFNEDKKAYSYPIDNYIVSVSFGFWKEFQNLQVGIDWDIINNEFVDLRNSETYQLQEANEEKQNRITQIDFELKAIDEKSIRCLRAFWAGSYTNADMTLIKELDSQAITLRNERTALNSAIVQ